MTKRHKVIRGDSLFELTISERYLGEINETRLSEQTQLTRINILENNLTSVFLDSKQGVITANKIQGVMFNAGSRPLPNTDYFKPVINNRDDQLEQGLPIFKHIVSPPDGRNMYVFCRYSNNRMSEMVIAISVDYKNRNQVVLHRPPIPNCNFPQANICLGNALNREDSSFAPDRIPEIVCKALSGGWNADWFRNEVKYIEKNGNMQIRWHKPIMHINECCEINNAVLNNIVNIIESPKTPSKNTITLDMMDQYMAEQTTNTGTPTIRTETVTTTT